MKLRCGPTPTERIAMMQEWHRWFAWRPVRVGSNDCRWLETVERRWVQFGGFFTDPIIEYRGVSK